MNKRYFSMRCEWLRLLLIASLLCLPVSAAWAEGRVIKPLQEWRGRVDNARGAQAPRRGYFATQAELDKLWAAWQIPGKSPKVDFVTRLVLVRTCNCSLISIAPFLSEQGDLQIQVTITKDLREDTGYIMVLIPRQGIKTVAGKPLEAD
jgi:hypothetical protein